MPEHCSVVINGIATTVKRGTTVAAAVLNSGCSYFRRSVSGEERGPLCGMGVCFECRLTVDGVPHARSCQIVCRDSMRINTHE
jgi:D-hydroxyproline dehydrogenase subunit gamma